MAPPISVSELEAQAREYVKHAQAPGTQRAEKSAMNSLDAFLDTYSAARPTPFLEPESPYDTESFVHNEITFCLMATWFAQIGLSANTVCTYVSLIKGALARELGKPLTHKEWEVRLPRLLRGVRRLHARVRKGRTGFRAQHHRAMRRNLGVPSSMFELMSDALLCVGRECLCRPGEMVPTSVEGFNGARMLTVGDIAFEVTESGSKYVRVMVRPSKKGVQATEKMPSTLPKGNGTADSYSALKRYLRARRAANGGRDLDPSEPLFPGMTTAKVRGVVRLAAVAAGLTAPVSGHSAAHRRRDRPLCGRHTGNRAPDRWALGLRCI